MVTIDHASCLGKLRVRLRANGVVGRLGRLGRFRHLNWILLREVQIDTVIRLDSLEYLWCYVAILPAATDLSGRWDTVCVQSAGHRPRMPRLENNLLILDRFRQNLFRCQTVASPHSFCEDPQKRLVGIG